MNQLKTNKQLYRTLIILIITLLPSVAVAHKKKQTVTIGRDEAPASSYAVLQEKKQTVTIQQTDISLKEVFAIIETQTNYSIAYEQSAIDIYKKVSLSFKDAEIEKVLNHVF